MKKDVSFFVIVLILIFCLMPSCSPRNQEGTLSQENLDKLSYNKLVNLGKKYRKSGDYRKALKAFDKAIESDGNKPDAYRARALIYYDTKKYNLSIMDLSKAIKLNPNSIEDYKLRGNIYFIFRDYDKALADYNKVLELDPRNIKALSRRSHILFKKKDYKAALEDTNRALMLDKSRYDLYLERGFEHFKLKNYESALKDYKTGLKMNPNSGTAIFGIAITLMALRRYEEAREYYNKAEELYRNMPEPVERNTFDGHILSLPNIYTNRAIVHTEFGEFQKAIDDCNRYLSLQEIRGDAEFGIYFVRGESYMLLGEEKKGRKDMKMWLEGWRAAGNKPETYIDYGDIGEAYLFQKKYKIAMKYFNKALEMEPTDTWSFLYRGITYFETGRYEKAKNDLEKVVANPERPFMKGIALGYIKKIDEKTGKK